MLVGPCRVAASGVNHAEDGIGADELPWENRRAAFTGVANQSLGIDGSDAAVSQRRAGCATVHLCLVDVDAFFILGGCTRWRPIGGAGASRKSVSGGLRWGVQIPGISDVVIDAG